jgi:hypothetical protein
MAFRYGLRHFGKLIAPETTKIHMTINSRTLRTKYHQSTTGQHKIHPNTMAMPVTLASLPDQHVFPDQERGRNHLESRST